MRTARYESQLMLNKRPLSGKGYIVEKSAAFNAVDNFHTVLQPKFTHKMFKN